MLEPDAHNLHQLSQVEEDTVDLNYKSHHGVSNKLAFGNAVQQAAHHLHTTTTVHCNVCPQNGLTHTTNSGKDTTTQLLIPKSVDLSEMYFIDFLVRCLYKYTH